MDFNSKALDTFKKSLDDQNRWSGINAKDWGLYFLNNVSSKLDKIFIRSDLTNSNFTQNLTNEELAIAILSWGGMNREHGKSLFKNKEWLEVIERMRETAVNRKDAYEQFKNLRKNKKLVGMGPAYFTKLICFANRDLNGYIMDQWTSKSMNILTGSSFINLTSQGSVSDRNSADTYEKFCNLIEELSDIVRMAPLDTEEALFSYGGRKKGEWRSFVIQSWGGPKKAAKSRSKVRFKSTYKIDYTDMEPIAYSEAKKSFDSSWIQIPTLGLQSSINVKVDGGSLIIQNSKSNELAIDENHWDKVMNRISELPQEERLKTSRYGQGKHPYNWDDCPNRVFSIYIPAVVRYIIENS